MPSVPGPVQKNLLGLLFRFGGVICFGFMAAMIKLGHQAGISTVELVFYRFLFGLPPLLLLMAATRDLHAWRTRRPLAHLGRTVLGLTTLALGFSALGFLPLAEATTISFAAPLFAVILSAILLREGVGRHRWTAVAVGLLGVAIVMRPGGQAVDPVGLLLALLAALGSAAVTITLRQIGRTESAATIVLWFSTLSIGVTGLILPFHAQAHDTPEWLILAALGLAGGAGQIFLTASLRAAPVGVVVPLDYAQLPWAVLLGWLIWADEPPTTTWLGALLIIAGALYTLDRERRLGREKAATPLVD